AKDWDTGCPRHIAAGRQAHDLRQGAPRQPPRIVAGLVLGLYRVAIFEPRLDPLVGERGPASAEERRRTASAGSAPHGRDIVKARRLPAKNVGTCRALDREAGELRSLGVVVDRIGDRGVVAGAVAATADGFDALDEGPAVCRRRAGVDPGQSV